MSNENITLILEKREVLGKQVRGLRREGQVPAVIHDHGKPSVHVMAPYMPIAKAYEHAGKHHPVSLSVGKQNYMALIKDVDFEPRKHQIRHVVFNAIKADEKQQTEVPVHFVEDAEIPAEKAGYMVIRNLDSVEIEALPKDLIDELRINPSRLTAIGDKLFVGDLQAPSGVTILTDGEHPIATVEETKAQMSEESEEVAEGEEGAASAGDSEDSEKAAEATAGEARTE